MENLIWTFAHAKIVSEMYSLRRFFIIMILLAIIAGTFIDPYIFGGTWRDYIIVSLVEMGCFIGGVCVGMIKQNLKDKKLF